MTANHWKRIEELFHGAASLEPDARRQYLEAACGEDRALYRQVESLILSVDDADSSGVLTGAVARAAGDILELPAGERIGAYQIIRKLGAGGMGAVYLACRADEQYRKTVAIKFLEGFGRPEVRARFHLERQILAGLEHPNIARLLDGGEAGGHPYLVMEFVDGIPIDQYVLRQRLSVRDRLELFCEACAAVSFAHRGLVVHRDIKPGNIIVTPDGTPKLLDFGIAKVLAGNDSPELTRPCDRLMTLEYASPEQVRGDPVTTATDVYSLGVLLYELMASKRPFEIDSTRPLDAARTICECEPAKPSAAFSGRRRRELAGDLDNIILTAIRKEPHRRYASVDAFSEDIERHLGGYPVRARQDTIGYRTGKFLRRNSIATVVSAIGFVVLSFLLYRLGAERARAQAGFTDAHELATGYLFDVESAIRNLPGATEARSLVVARGVEYLDRLAKTGDTGAALQRELADGYAKIAAIQFDARLPSLADPEAALVSAHKELAIREQLAGKGNAGDRMKLANCYLRIASIERTREHRQAADAALDRATSLVEAVKAIADANPDAAPTLIDYQLALQDMLVSTDRAAAISHGTEACRLAEARLEKGHATQEDRSRAIVARLSVMQVLIDQRGRVAPEYRHRFYTLMHSAESDARQMLRESPANIDAQRLSLSIQHVGCIPRDALPPSQTIVACRQAIAGYRQMVDADPKDLSAYLSLCALYRSVGDHLADMKKIPEALAEFQNGLAMAEIALRLRPGNLQIRRTMVSFLMNVSLGLRDTGHVKAALDQCLRAATLEAPIYREVSEGNREAVIFTDLQARLGDLEVQMHNQGAARESYQLAAAVLAILEQRRAIPPGFKVTEETLRSKIAALN